MNGLSKILVRSNGGEVLTLGTFFCLYVAQSVPSSFLSTALQVLMRENNFSLSTIGLLQMVKLPWILKFLWAPLIDRNCVTVAHYKRCIISSELAYAVILLVMGMFHIATDIYLIIALVILSLVASGTQDIATDALAVLSFTKRDKSMVNSMQSMGGFGGTLLGSGVLLIVLHRYGWGVVLPCLCIFVLLALIPLLFNKRLTIAEKTATERARAADFLWFFARRSIWRQVGFLLIYYAGLIGILSMLRPYLVDNGYTMRDIGIMSGILGTCMACLSSLGAGFIVRRIGICRARILFAVLTLCTTVFFLAQSFLPVNTVLLCLGIVLLWGSYGFASVVVYVSSMNCVRSGREGTDFTVQIVLTHASGMLMAAVAGALSDRIGYHGLFAAEVAIAALSLVYVLAMFKKTEAKNE